MRLIFSEPVIIDRGPTYEEAGWGPYQFPHLYRLDDGRILYAFADSGDTIDAYGAERKCFVSADNGKTWESVRERDFMHKWGMPLDNGDRISFIEQNSIPITERMQFPEPAAQRGAISYYRREKFDESICSRTWILHRVNSEHPEGVDEQVTLNWPNMTIHAGNGIVVPPQPWGELRMAPDGSLWMPTYARGLDPENGGFSPYYNNYTFRSVDHGKTWDMMHFMNYCPNTREFAHAFRCEGFNENDIGFAPDGTYFRMVRTNGTEPILNGPMYVVRSHDQGKTWSKPEKFDDFGVWPQICTLDCGVTLLSYGRPGLRIRATADPACLQWEEPVDIVQRSQDQSVWETGCSYSAWLKLDDHTAALAYSNFQIKDEQGIARKTMLYCTVTVEG